MSPGGRPRAVVCGTGFGRVYLAGLAGPGSPAALAGVLARGSERSRACAERYGVPLYRDPDELPGDVDLACVVVPAAMNGGRGAELAQALLARGVHVLQEHPLHASELAACLRAARASGAGYRLSTHHVHVAATRRFVAAARSLAGRGQPPLLVDVTTSVQVLTTALDIAGEALGRLRPWGFAEPPVLPAEVRALTPLDVPYRSLDGVLGGVPCTLRVQHQMDPREPDNHAHVWHRITIGFEGGTLTLAGSAGPVLWSPRPHLPREAAGATGFDELSDTHLTFPSAAALGPAEGPTWAEILTRHWPEAVQAAAGALLASVEAGESPMRKGQYHLGLCELAAGVLDRLGKVELVERARPRVLGPGDLPDLPDDPEAPA